MKRIHLLIIATLAAFASCTNEHEDIRDSSYIEVKASYYSRALGMEVKDTIIMDGKVISDIPEDRDVDIKIQLTPGASKWESVIIRLERSTDPGKEFVETLDGDTIYMSTTLFSGKGKGLKSEPYEYTFTTKRGHMDVLFVDVQDNIWGVTRYKMTIKSKPEYEIAPIPEEDLND